MTARFLLYSAVATAALLLSFAATPPATAPANAFTDAQYQDHLRHVKEKLAGLPGQAAGNFTILIQQPFIVTGNDTPDRVRASCANTIQWTVDHLKKDFFTKEPADILEIYLFKDKTSYDQANKDLFPGAPDTPYGYYSPAHKALVMNIATGGGTLVHEIVHPFMAANFPACPTWFNEGLASLYEQSTEKDGHIWGLPNWRLAGLKDALRAPAGGANADNAAPSFRDMCSMDANTFYAGRKGANYATARYLCLYLQDKGTLPQFYKDFVKNQKTDPTGYDTLQKTLATLGEKDMTAFRKKWETWVLSLQYP